MVAFCLPGKGRKGKERLSLGCGQRGVHNYGNRSILREMQGKERNEKSSRKFDQKR